MTITKSTIKKTTTLLSFPLIVALAGCAAPPPTPQIQVPTAVIGPLTYAITDSANVVARDIAQQFPQLSAFHKYQDVHNPLGNIERSGVIARSDGNTVHLDYRHYRMIIAGPDRSEVTTSTLCDLSILPVQGIPGKFTITSSPVKEKSGRDLFLYLPVATIDKIATDIGRTLLKLRQTDTARETSRLRQNAVAGNAYAQNDLGVIYAMGEGVPQNYVEAVSWFRKSAEQGFAIAQYNLGLKYYYGQGVPKDYVEVVKWYRKAAEQGHAEAQNDLGVMYANGNGVLQDYTQAYKWWMLSKASPSLESKRSNNASYNMDIYAKRMTPEQIAHAQQEASAWQAQHSGGR